MQEDRRGTPPRGHLDHQQGRSTTVPVPGLVHRWPDPVRRIQRQHHSSLAGVRYRSLRSVRLMRGRWSKVYLV